MVTAWSPWPRPEWVDALNATGTHVGSPAVVVDLEVGELLDHARGLTGLDDFGGEEFLEPLRILLDSVERDGDLHVVGRSCSTDRSTRRSSSPEPGAPGLRCSMIC
ncbi:MAG: hypothetical protein ACXW2Y_07790 [Acidimicrobiia bacterium]